jgi:glutathione S-transferase
MVLEDGTSLGESNAIAWYLAEGSELMPSSALSWAQCIRRMNYEQTVLDANITPVRFVTYIVPELQQEHAADIPGWRERGNQGLATLYNHLQHNDFITDHGYSVAGIAVFGFTYLANEDGFDLASYKYVSQRITRVEAQSGCLPINQLLTGQNQVLAA